MDGAAIHVNSNEAKEQISCNERRKEEMASKQNAAAAAAMSEEEGGDTNWVGEMGSLSQSCFPSHSFSWLYVIFNALRMSRNQHATRVKINLTSVNGLRKQ